MLAGMDDQEVQVTPEMVDAAAEAMPVSVVDQYGVAWLPEDWAPDLIRAVLAVALAQRCVIVCKSE